MTEYEMSLTLRDNRAIDFEMWLQLQGEEKTTKEFLLNNYLNENEMGSVNTDDRFSCLGRLKLLFAEDYGEIIGITVRTVPSIMVVNLLKVGVARNKGTFVDFCFPEEDRIEEGLHKLARI